MFGRRAIVGLMVVQSVVASAATAGIPVFHCMGQVHADAELLGAYDYVPLASGLVYYSAALHANSDLAHSPVVAQVEIVENCATRERITVSYPPGATIGETVLDALIHAAPAKLAATVAALVAAGVSATLSTVDWESCACAIERDPANLPLPGMQPPGILQEKAE